MTRSYSVPMVFPPMSVVPIDTLGLETSAVNLRIEHGLGPCGATLDEGERRPRTLHWVAGSRVIGIARKDDKLGVRDHPLPGCGFLDTGEPAAVGRDDQGRTRNFRHVGPGLGAGDC